jgi:AcrR family transcriptional regulator
MTPTRSSSRQLLLDAIVLELSRNGPSGVDAAAVCRNLGLSPSLVNHYFGSRAQLLIEAAVVAYERYVDLQIAAIDAAGDTGEEQLRAWIDAQVSWTVLNLGAAIVMDFPRMHIPQGAELGPDEVQRLDVAASRNLVALASILDRIQSGARGKSQLTREQIVGRPDLVSATSHIGWLTYGHSLWRAGRHAPTVDSPDARRLAEHIFAQVPDAAILLTKALAAPKGTQAT